MAGIGNAPSMRGYHFEPYQFAMTLATGITTADVGKAVSVDTSGDNKVKLAIDDSQIIGRLETVETRTQEGVLIGTVALHFADLLPVKTGLTGAEAVVVGSTVMGAGAGEVKARVVSAAAAPDYSINRVTSISTGYAVVVKVS